MGIQEEIAELTKKAGAYTLLKEEHEQLLQAVDESIQKLNNALKMFKVSSPTGERRSASNLQPVIDQIYDKMRLEGFVTSVKKIIEMTGIEEKQAYYVTLRLRDKEGVQQVSGGKKSELFYAKTTSKKSQEEAALKIGKTSFMG